MESSQVFKSVEARIKNLEQQLEACEDSLKQCEHSGKEAERDIEEHFAKCMNALAERKAVLLGEAALKVTNQKSHIEDTLVRLDTSIKACQMTLKGGSMIYAASQSSAELIWKSVLSVPSLDRSLMRVTTRLPLTLFNDIQKHGEVVDTSRFSKAEMVTTLAGSSQGLKDGKGSVASFNYPLGVCMNIHDQSLYICDRNNNSIRRLTMEGDVTTFVEKDQVKTPFDIAMNYKVNCFYVASRSAHTIMKITSSGTVSPFAGSGEPGRSDGVGSNASFNYPCGITIDQQTGNIFVSDQSNHLIRKITPQGEVSTLAGSQPGFADGNGTAAKFSHPHGICFDENSHSLLVCDQSNNKLREVQLNGEVTTLCHIQGPPQCVAVTANKIILVSSGANTLYKVSHEGSQQYKVEVLAGSGRGAREDGPPDECSFHTPGGIAVHEASHSCLVADYNGHAIRRVSFVNLS